MSIQSILLARSPSTNSQAINRPTAHMMVLGMLHFPFSEIWVCLCKADDDGYAEKAGIAVSQMEVVQMMRIGV